MSSMIWMRMPSFEAMLSVIQMRSRKAMLSTEGSELLLSKRVPVAVGQCPVTPLDLPIV